MSFHYAFFIIILIAIAPQTLAFNALTHEQIVKSAFHYFNTHSQLSHHTVTWLKKGNSKIQNEANEIEKILIRSTIDVDYLSDLWFDAWYRAPFAGGRTKYFGMLTSLYHFLNARSPGKYWPYDGYAYSNTDGTGNDAYIGFPGIIIRGDLSSPLKGTSYNLNFKGHNDDWQKLYFSYASMRTVTLPPCNVPAQIAYNKMLSSNRASEDKVEIWSGKLDVAENLIFSNSYTRRFKRQELKDLPAQLDQLGVTLHMAQDLAVPHHAQGTTGYCHNEFEKRIDELICDKGKEINNDNYDWGIFDLRESNECQKLYDPLIVEELISHNPAFDFKNIENVFTFLIDVAKISATWEWKKVDENPVGTILPNTKAYSDNLCAKLVNNDDLQPAYKYQYNLAVAATIILIEMAARDYELRMLNSPFEKGGQGDLKFLSKHKKKSPSIPL